MVLIPDPEIEELDPLVPVVLPFKAPAPPFPTVTVITVPAVNV